jgi:SAM-dependent methyltransferase
MPDAFDADVVAGFGDEWKRFDQTDRAEGDLRETFDNYFRTFPWSMVAGESRGFDLGCGSGRWARFVAERCGHLTCIDPSPEALEVARRNLNHLTNVDFQQAAAGDLPYAESSFDFGYSLGVLHHTPDPARSLRDAVRVLKPGSPFLVYVYYALDNRPIWFRLVWRASNVMRLAISRLPHRWRYVVSQAIAAVVYWPLARVALLAEKVGLNSEHLPLTSYRRKSFYVMRTDALDRFGTRIEHRFTRSELVEWMRLGGLEHINVALDAPFWCATGLKIA